MYIIAGQYRHQRLATPKGMQTRPTASRLRESLFNICQGFIENARFLDLFAGSGAIGFEALSRGAQAVTFIDASKEAVRCQQTNASKLDVQTQCQILHGQVLTLLPWLEKQRKQYDIIFADPPYATTDHPEEKQFYSEKIVRFLDASTLLAEKGVLFIEEESGFEPQINDLRKLQLVDSRRMGHTTLQRYEWNVRQ